MIWCEKLPLPVVAQLQLHEHFPKEVLVGIAFQLQDRLGKQHRKNLPLLLVVAFDGVEVHLFPRLIVPFVHRVRDGAG